MAKIFYSMQYVVTANIPPVTHAGYSMQEETPANPHSTELANLGQGTKKRLVNNFVTPVQRTQQCAGQVCRCAAHLP